jgi:hypothetical protein
MKILINILFVISLLPVTTFGYDYNLCSYTPQYVVVSELNLEPVVDPTLQLAPPQPAEEEEEAIVPLGPRPFPATSPFAVEGWPPPAGEMGELIRQPGPQHMYRGNSQGLLWHLRGPLHNMQHERYLRALGPEQQSVLHSNLHNTRPLFHKHQTRNP